MSSSEATQPLEATSPLSSRVNSENTPFFDDAVLMAIATIKKIEDTCGAHGKATITINHEYGNIILSI